MTYNPNPSGKTWNQCLTQLGEVFDKWRLRGKWTWQCAASSMPTKGRTHWAEFRADQSTRAVTVTFEHPTGQRSVTVSKFATPVDNLWAIQIGLDAIRLNEQRGLDDVAREFYQALPAPVAKRDPYEVLGIRPDAPREIADAAYRALAKSMHSDVGGDDERMKELNAAYEEVKAR